MVNVKHYAIACITLVMLLIIPTVKAAGDRLIDYLDEVIIDMQNDYDEMERLKSSISRIQERMHERANKIRQVQCALGAEDKCPELPESLGVYTEIGLAHNATVTNYHSVPNQTDHDPCIAAWGHDICHFSEQGIDVVAVSRDLLSVYEEGDWVYLQHNNEMCTGVFMVLDKLNHSTESGKQIANQFDIYRNDRRVNHGVCYNVRAVKIDDPIPSASSMCGLPDSAC